MFYMSVKSDVFPYGKKYSEDVRTSGIWLIHIPNYQFYITIDAHNSIKLHSKATEYLNS